MNNIPDIIKQSGLNFSERMFVIANDKYFSSFGDYDWAETESIKKVAENKLKPYSWQLVKPKQDKVTHQVYSASQNLGYYIRSRKGANAVAPINTCYVISQPDFKQNVHNVIVAEEGSKLQILTGCTADHQMPMNIHNGVTEIYVKKDAQVIFTMVHAWSKSSEVYPRTAVNVEKGGKFVSNYLIFDPISKLETNPKVYLNGESSKAVLKSFIYSHPESKINLAGEIHLNAQQTRGEIETHAVVGGGNTITRGTLFGRAEGIRAHLECSAIVLTPDSTFQTIPALRSELDNLDMSHEASIGKISNDQIEYLQSRGISKDKARQMVVRGFIDKSVGDLSPLVQTKINQILAKTAKGF